MTATEQRFEAEVEVVVEVDVAGGERKSKENAGLQPLEGRFYLRRHVPTCWHGNDWAVASAASLVPCPLCLCACPAHVFI